MLSALKYERVAQVRSYSRADGLFKQALKDTTFSWLKECLGMVRHEGASLLAEVYSITGIDVMKAPPDLRPKGLGGQ